MTNQVKQEVKDSIIHIIFEVIYGSIALVGLVCIWFLNNFLVCILYTIMSIIFLVYFVFDITIEIKEVMKLIDTLDNQKEKQNESKEKN